MNIYIHIPFCHQKCHYCYYYSFVPRSKKIVDEYLHYLEKEFYFKNKKLNFSKTKNISTIYVGGGTPNYFSDDQLKKLFLILKKYLNLVSVKEFIVELNPAACSLRQLKILKENKVTRISFGIQTLNAKILKKINRHYINDPSEIIQVASSMGFAINLDFMLGLPGQKIEDIIGDILFVKKIKPESSFWCELRLGTKKIKKHLDIPSHEKTVKMYEFVKNNILKIGYKQSMPEYFSNKEKMPLYLENWWTSQNSLGFGLSAFSKVDNIFYKNTDNFKEYADFLMSNKLPIRYLYKLGKKEEALLNLISQLKKGGADLGEIRKKFNIDLKKYLAPEIKKLISLGWIVLKKNKIIFSKKGFTISSPVSNMLMHRNEHLGKIMDTAFNFIGGSSNLEEFISKNFTVLNKDKSGKIVFTSPDKESIGILKKYEKK